MGVRFRLASQMGCTVEELSKRLSAREYAHWVQHYAEHPTDGDRIVFQIAVLCALVANAFRGKGSRRARPKDFLPRYGETKPKTREDWARIESAMMAQARAHNAALERARK